MADVPKLSDKEVVVRLAALGISHSAEKITLTLAAPDGVPSRYVMTPMGPGPFTWRKAFFEGPVQLRHKHRDNARLTIDIRKNGVRPQMIWFRERPTGDHA
mgnify:CR=1 FL=1